MKRILSRREFLRMAAAASGGAILAACGAQTPAQQPTAAPAGEQPTAAPAPASGAKTVTWWYAWGNFQAAVDKIVETPEFKEMMGDTVLEHKGSVNMEAILTAIAGGTPPDGGSNFSYPNLWARGAVLAVDDRVGASSLVKKDDMIPALWDSTIYDGKMIGVPGIESYLWWGLNYNAKAAQDAGLDPNTPPLTWEDLLVWHKALTKFDGAGNLQQFGLDPYDAMASEPDFGVQSFGGFNWWDEQARTFNLNNDALAQCFETCGEFIKIIGPDKLAGMRQDENLGGWGASYNAGIQTMIIEGYWHPGETQIQKPEIAQYNRSTWAPVPASRAGKKIMATGAHMVQLFKDGKNPDGMFKVAEFLLTDTALDIIFKEVGWITGKLSWLQKVDPKTYPGLDFYVAAPDQVDEWIVGRRCPIHPFVVTQYTELREQVFRGNMTGKDAAAEMQSRAEAEWKAQGLS
ncbi:MAG TPA: twin-arginine translocation signal domain-containing protein [Roseiflexaceae bacterium]|nr:twin-arginine translocation signal domain-containing protein [Roseiflexaceae bacterium]